MAGRVDQTGDMHRRVRFARETAGLSQAQVADALGIHRPSVSEIEAGRRGVKSEELVALARLFGVSLAWLAGETEADSDGSGANLELAARELSKLHPNDLERLLRLLAAFRREDDAG